MKPKGRTCLRRS
uniref:Uncharacterized protein n=1 Tax=Arundo donax TaxID=35708 RepID=A0A0A8ZTB4_ARUDO